MKCLYVSQCHLRWLVVCSHYGDVIMGTIASQITSLTIVYSTVYSDAEENIKAPRHWPLCGEFTRDQWIPPHKWPVTRKMFSFHDVIMQQLSQGYHASLSTDIDGPVQDCSISIANALEILQSCIEPSISCWINFWKRKGMFTFSIIS